MALHKVAYPKSARLLFRVVALQKRLLKALADPGLSANAVDTTWLQGVWPSQEADWVRKFCLGGMESALHPIREVAAASLQARQALLSEFIRQNRVAKMLAGGGDFRELTSLQNFTPALAESVKKLFGRFYQRLGHNVNEGWIGYEFARDRAINNRAYKDDFCAVPPTSVVCPYCDGEIGTSDLDHYYPKSGYPLLACSPWNLVPICKSCNNHVTAKGDQPPLSLGPPPSANDWLHPFSHFTRFATDQVTIRLSGSPRDSIPQLHSPDATELRRVTNHFSLLNQERASNPSRDLSKRWTRNASGYFDKLVRDARRKGHAPGQALRAFVTEQLDDHLADRGKAASTLIKAAVCRAVLDGRPEYESEFEDSNPPEVC
jgi:hypothetical protein